MSDYKFPELPSDDELGITDDDREQFAKDFPDDGQEMSEAELAALLGESPVAKPGPAAKPAPAAPSPQKDSSASQPKGKSDETKVRAQAAKEVRKAEKKRTKEEAKAAKESARQAKAEAKERARQEKAAARQTASETESAVPAWRGPATLVILLLVAVFSSSRTGIPGPVPANAPDTAFSSARAMATLVELAREAHPTGSPEHARVRQLVVDRLADLGIESEIQTTTSVLPAPRVRVPDGVAQLPDFVRTATVRNIVARIPGTASTGTVLITAHYDSREIAVGAADDGAGVVTLIEAVRAIRSGEPLRNDLIILFTDAEELGLLGARAFVDQHRWMADVDLALSVEMRGAGGPSIMFETNELNGWVVEALADFDPAPFTTSLAYEVYKRMPNDTDFTPFREAGVQGMNFAAIDNAHVYHQAFDTPDNLSESTLQHHGLHALSALQYFGGTDLSEVNAPNRVYFSVPGIGLITYPQAAVHLLSALLVGLFAVFVLVAVRGGARPVGALAGLGIAVVVGGAGFGMGTTLLDRVSERHAEVGALHGSLFHSEGWYVLAVAFGTLAVMTAVVAVGRRWLSRDEVMIGALVLPIVAAVGFGIAAPLGAMHLQLPALAAVLAALIASLLGTRATGVLGWLATLLLAVPVLLILLPIVELVWLALTLRLLGALAVLIAVGMLLCLPALDALRAPNVWWAPASVGALAALSLGVGVAVSGSSDRRPAPSTLAYAYEHGSGEALWITGPSQGGDADGASGRSWAEERAEGPFDETRDVSAFGYLGGVVPVRRASVTSAQPPLVEVLADSIVGSERFVELGVRSAVGAEMLGFQLSEGTRLRAINGFELENADAIRRADHWGEPDGSVRLTLTMPSAEPIGMHVVEHLLRPEELLGDAAFQRPAGLAPNVNRLSDRAMFRYSVAAFVDPRHAFLGPTGRPNTGVPADTLVIRPAVDANAAPIGDSAAIDTTAVDTAAIDTIGAADTVSDEPAASLPVDTLAILDTIISAQPVFIGSRQ